MLELRNISKTFNPGTVNEKKALNGLSVTLEDGDFVTIVGSNGAGKSTLFNAIAGDFYVDEGSIALDGQDITYLPAHKRSRQIGRLFQDPMRGTAPHMTIEENLSLAYLRAGKPRNAYFSRITKKDKEFFRQQLFFQFQRRRLRIIHRVLRAAVCGQPVRIWGHQPDQRRGLLRLRPVGICTFRHQPPAHKQPDAQRRLCREL